MRLSVKFILMLKSPSLKDGRVFMLFLGVVWHLMKEVGVLEQLQYREASQPILGFMQTPSYSMCKGKESSLVGGKQSETQGTVW